MKKTFKSIISAICALSMLAVSAMPITAEESGDVCSYPKIEAMTSENHAYTYAELSEMTDSEICKISESIAEHFEYCKQFYCEQALTGKINALFDKSAYPTEESADAVINAMNFPSDMMRIKEHAACNIDYESDAKECISVSLHFRDVSLAQFQRAYIALLCNDKITESIPCGNIWYNDYYMGHEEGITYYGYIVKKKNPAASVGAYSVVNVKLAEESFSDFDGLRIADYSDDVFDGFTESDEDTGIYLVSDIRKNIENNPELELLYVVYQVNRNGYFIEYDDIYFTTCHELGGGHYKMFKPDELLENDADNDGAVTAEDALAVLNSVVGMNTFTVKEKIQLGIVYSSNYRNEACNKYRILYENRYDYINTEKALEILNKIVE